MSNRELNAYEDHTMTLPHRHHFATDVLSDRSASACPVAMPKSASRRRSGGLKPETLSVGRLRAIVLTIAENPSRVVPHASSHLCFSAGRFWDGHQYLGEDDGLEYRRPRCYTT